MNRAIVVKIFRISLAGVLIFGLSAPGYPMMVGNYSEKGFDEPGGGTTAISSTTASETIKDLIIKSATYFLKGKSNIDLLASKLEAANQEELGFYEFQTIVNEALNNMREARSYYQTLKLRADATPYNQAVIMQLINFDYDSLMEEYNLNGDIFNQVKVYLQAGDIRGTYRRFFNYTDNIVGMLETVQTEVTCWNFPEMNNIWKLIQECSQMHLFGQYIAQTFYNL
jgi:hypothetical protein